MAIQIDNVAPLIRLPTTHPNWYSKLNTNRQPNLKPNRSRQEGYQRTYLVTDVGVFSLLSFRASSNPRFPQLW
ncbi:hypothetical protein Hanom_Chr15g01357481 [Helianthus anomalus]